MEMIYFGEHDPSALWLRPWWWLATGSVNWCYI